MSKILTSTGCLALSVAMTTAAVAMPHKKDTKSALVLAAAGRHKPKVPSYLFIKRNPQQSTAMVLVHAAGYVARAARPAVGAYQVALNKALDKLTAAEVQGIAEEVAALRRTAGQNAEDLRRYTKATRPLLVDHYPEVKGAKGADPLDLHNVPGQAFAREYALQQAVNVIWGALRPVKK